MPKKGYLNPPASIKPKGTAQVEEKWTEVNTIP